ncbi:MAG: bifunctional DNA-formamidopyrimidine glycosylase/DNA-(apurinic or apyrimidinic site) lyase [Micrococcus sp.]|nr:bifunctional DNA-formamidopyrimidine glycosylase/DNA-(apurinic or apyrimidinic site) lyase [Micrococcus sp.]
MPELPEVEVVRRGMEPFVRGALGGVLAVLDPRSLRRSPGGPTAMTTALAGRRLGVPQRRGKFLWLTFDDDPDAAVVIHLGMSGQVRVDDREQTLPRHTRLRWPVETVDHGAKELRFVDQRIFGGWWVDTLVVDPHTGERLPSTAAHIGLDPLHPQFSPDAVHESWVQRRSALKRALLDQSLVSGIGNIYADEALWQARLHPLTPLASMTPAQSRDVLASAAAVMRRALAVGGTSFDALYVNVDGRSGYFARSLSAYGRTGQPCPRCNTPIVREQFMNRSSFFCPRCQPLP